ncbi:MAG: hypothetical protein HY390_03205 [Deltaproteobacteria bacterium]|nr:hypothetical protein [Deltaproteobacteria bacterium]
MKEDLISFRALSSGLGIRSPIITLPSVKKIEPLAQGNEPQKRSFDFQVHHPIHQADIPGKREKKILSWYPSLQSSLRWVSIQAFDHIGVILFFLFLVFLSNTALHISNEALIKLLLEHPWMKWIYGGLFAILYFFYFVFFKQFKLPTLGKWLIDRP